MEHNKLTPPLKRDKPTPREVLHAELAQTYAALESMPPPSPEDSHEYTMARLTLTLRYCQILQAQVKILDAELTAPWKSFTRITAPFMAMTVAHDENFGGGGLKRLATSSAGAGE